jgi:hypothetical protein
MTMYYYRWGEQKMLYNSAGITDECCCDAAPPCESCTEPLPPTLTLTITGMSGGPSPECLLNGTYTISAAGACQWRYDISPPNKSVRVIENGGSWEVITNSRYFDGANFITCNHFFQKDVGATDWCHPEGSYTCYTGTGTALVELP